MLLTAKKLKQNLVIAALSLALIGGTMIPMSAETVSAASGTADPVTNAAITEVPIKGVSFPSSVTLKPGESKTLTVNVTPSNTTYLTNIAWGYQTNGCFKVKTNGSGTYWGKPSSETITAEKAGTGYLNTTVKIFDSTGKYLTKYEFSTTVTVSGSAATQQPAASASSGSANSAANANATITEVPIKGVSFPSSVSLKKGESKTLNVSTTPSNTTYLTNIEWGYQTNGCFKVKTNGSGTYWGKPSSETITAEKAGTGYLNNTVKIYDSKGKYLTKYDFRTTVTVSDPAASKPTTAPTQSAAKPTQQASKTVALTSISLSKTSVTLNPGKTASLGVIYYPSNTTASKTVTWSSSNTAVARVSNGTITAVSAGTATITGTCNGKKATCRVTVNASEKYWNVSEAYTLLNNFRTTKSNQWYWKSDNKTKQKVSGLKSLKRDAELEKVAKLRAKEQWIMAYERGKYTHTRPNGKAWSTAYPKSLTTKAENLAWGHDSCKSVITDADGWAETYENYANQGHRRNMLSKKVTKVGIACYEKDGCTCWAMCLGK